MLSNRKPCDILTWQSLKSLLLHMPPPSRQPKFNDKVALVIVPLKGTRSLYPQVLTTLYMIEDPINNK